MYGLSGRGAQNLLVALFAALLVWYPAAAAAGTNKPIVLTLRGAGIVEVEGHIYTEAQGLKVALKQLSRKRPHDELEVVVPLTEPMETVTPALLLLKKVGIGPLRFAIEISPDPMTN